MLAVRFTAVPGRVTPSSIKQQLPSTNFDKRDYSLGPASVLLIIAGASAHSGELIRRQHNEFSSYTGQQQALDAIVVPAKRADWELPCGPTLL
jgi:hypothetical protein